MGYLGDTKRQTLHDLDTLRAACLETGLDVRDLVPVHSNEFATYLLRSERWAECGHCCHHATLPVLTR